MRIFRLRGVIDHNNASDKFAWPARALAREPRLCLDLSAVTGMDTAALAVLVKLLAEARKLGGEVRLTAASEAVVRALELTRLDGLFPICAQPA